jgi:hypothetical protein
MSSPVNGGSCCKDNAGRDAELAVFRVLFIFEVWFAAVASTLEACAPRVVVVSLAVRSVTGASTLETCAPRVAVVGLGVAMPSLALTVVFVSCNSDRITYYTRCHWKSQIAIERLNGRGQSG